MVFVRPQRDLMRLQEELERFFDSTFGGTFAPSGRGVYPAVNIFDCGNAIAVKAEVPGVRLQDVDLVIENDKLTISGERKVEYEGPNLRFHRREREEGGFRRVIRLPAKLDSEGAKAAYKNGVLTVTIPKASEVQPRKISVQGA